MTQSYPCPSCETVQLQQRQVSRVPFVECPECLGTFFSVDHLCAFLDEKTGDREAGPEFLRLLAQALAADEPDGGVTRACIVCGVPLQRFGFGEHPLIIADRCAAHGLWLDQRDLSKVERQVRASLRVDEVDGQGGFEPKSQGAPPPGHRVVCPNCQRRYPETFLDKRCEDCNVSMYMD